MKVKSKVLVVNKDALPGKEKKEHPAFAYQKREVTKRSDFNQCYVALYDIPPEKSSYPYHYHTQNTEVFYVLQGQGVLVTCGERRPIQAGDFAVCPPGEEGGHRIYNTSKTQTLTYIDFDTTHSPDVIHYPDSGKIGVVIHNYSSAFFRTEDAVEYYKGEEE